MEELCKTLGCRRITRAMGWCLPCYTKAKRLGIKDPAICRRCHDQVTAWDRSDLREYAGSLTQSEVSAYVTGYLAAMSRPRHSPIEQAIQDHFWTIRTQIEPESGG